MSKENKEANFEKLVYRVLLFVLFVGVIALSLYVVKFGVPWPISSLGSISDFGAFGDFVGGLMNPLLQFIVIAMLFWSIHVQRQDLQATRETLIATKDELKETKDANERQADSLEQQIDIYRNKEEFDKQLMQINGIEKSIEDLLDKKLLLAALGGPNQKIETTLGYILYAPYSPEAHNFNNACCADDKLVSGVGFIQTMTHARFLAYTNCLSKGISENIIPFDVIDWKLDYFVSMVCAFFFHGIILEKYVLNIITTFDISITNSNLKDKQKNNLNLMVIRMTAIIEAKH